MYHEEEQNIQCHDLKNDNNEQVTAKIVHTCGGGGVGSRIVWEVPGK